MSSNASPSPQPAPGTNLFVASLPPGTNDARLRELFGAFGRIVSAKVMVDLKTRTLRNHGFVRFDKAEEAQQAIATMHRRRLDDSLQPLHVVASTHKDDAVEGEECEVVYVRNLPEGVTAEAIRKHFNNFGDVSDVLIPPNTGSHQGVCFVRLGAVDSARRAVQPAHNTTPFGAEKALQVRFKESRKESQRRGKKTSTRTPGSNGTTPHGSPNDASLSVSQGMLTPGFVPLSVSPNNASMHTATSPPGMMLVPIMQAPQATQLDGNQSPTGTGSPNYGTPLAANLQGPSALPSGMSLMDQGQPHQSPTQPQFSLAQASAIGPTVSVQPQQRQQQQQQSIPIQLTPQQHHLQIPIQPQQQQQQQQSQQQRPFPGTNDLFFSNFCSQEWLLDLVRPFQPVFVQPGPGTVIVRLRDEALHVVAAQSLNGMVGPTGMQLTAALVRM